MLRPDHGQHYRSDQDVLAAWLRGTSFLDTLSNAKVSKELVPNDPEILVALSQGRRPVVLTRRGETWALKEKP